MEKEKILEIIHILRKSSKYIAKGIAEGVFKNCAIKPIPLPEELLKIADELESQLDTDL